MSNDTDSNINYVNATSNLFGCTLSTVYRTHKDTGVVEYLDVSDGFTQALCQEKVFTSEAARKFTEVCAVDAPDYTFSATPVTHMCYVVAFQCQIDMGVSEVPTGWCAFNMLSYLYYLDSIQ